jgi:Uma2 family endonuclease
MYATALQHDVDDDALDDVVVLHDVTWRDYLRVLSMRGENPVPRIHYLDGELELMSPGGPHEERKTVLGHLLEAWLIDRGYDFRGRGSWTLKKEKKKAGAEPDECYILGTRRKRLPDLAIEVDWSRTGIAKHSIYMRLGVRELWTLRPDGTCIIRVLTRGSYVERPKSKVLPDLDVHWLLGFVDIDPPSSAIRALHKALRKRGQRRR